MPKRGQHRSRGLVFGNENCERENLEMPLQTYKSSNSSSKGLQGHANEVN